MTSKASRTKRKSGPKTRQHFATQADYLRHHRRCFEFALERGITPAQAEEELAKIDHLEAIRKSQCSLDLGEQAQPRAAAKVSSQQSYENNARLLGERTD